MQTGEGPILGVAHLKADGRKSQETDLLQERKGTHFDREDLQTQTVKHRRTQRPDVERHRHSSMLSMIDYRTLTMRAIEQEQTDAILAGKLQSEMLT